MMLILLEFSIYQHVNVNANQGILKMGVRSVDVFINILHLEYDISCVRCTKYSSKCTSCDISNTYRMD